ncbi:MAG: hypothetical protein K2J63_11360 [Muribaculaceae bacterium]|nr:hypothetical protein [Muribaculaceae bacterium]MDE6795885.1 hypothetical protein [Muribaculaceae bacterium]
MKKSETIAMYRDAYLEGKDEVDRRSFEEKDETRQYAAIMSWRRRQEQAATDREASPSAVLDAVKKARKVLLALNELAPKDRERLSAATAELKADIDNFDIILKGRRLRELRSQRTSLDKEIELLESEGIQEC